MLDRLRRRARTLKAETLALYLACRDPRTPWSARLVIAGVVAYALSPIDLIPDFIPLLGYLDDLILLPAGIALAISLIPAEVFAEYRAQAQHEPEGPGSSRAAAVVIVVLWLIGLAAVVKLVLRRLRAP